MWLCAIQMKITEMYRKHTFYMKLVNNQNGNQTSIVLQNNIKNISHI